MEERAIENGQISWHHIITILDNFCNGIRDDVRKQVNAIQQGQALLQPVPPNGAAANGHNVVVREAKVPCSAIVEGSGMCLPHLHFQLVWSEMLDGNFGSKGCQALQWRVRMVTSKHSKNS